MKFKVKKKVSGIEDNGAILATKRQINEMMKIKCNINWGLNNLNQDL